MSHDQPISDEEMICGFSGAGLDAVTEQKSRNFDVHAPHQLIRASDDHESDVELEEDSGIYLMPELRALGLTKSAHREGEIRPRRVQGPDDRARITETHKYPWRAICLLVMKKGNKLAQGTGWFAGANSVVTAAHNLYDNRELGSGWVDSVEVSPAINGVSQPWKTAHVTRTGIAVSRAWRSGHSNRAFFDFGLLVLNEPLGNQTGWFTLVPWNNSQLTGKMFNVVGYPGEGRPPDQPHAKFIPKFTLWGDVGLITSAESHLLKYQMDSTGGQSGCPVFARDETGSDGGMFCVGIHTQGQIGQNQAVRITGAVIQEIKDF